MRELAELESVRRDLAQAKTDLMLAKKALAKVKEEATRGAQRHAIVCNRLEAVQASLDNLRLRYNELCDVLRPVISSLPVQVQQHLKIKYDIP